MQSLRESTRHLQTVPHRLAHHHAHLHASDVPSPATTGLEASITAAVALAELAGRPDVSHDLLILKKRVVERSGDAL